MNLNIRLEKEEDFYKTEEVTRKAFWNLYKPGCDEHYLVHLIRKHKDFIPNLSFIIELDGKLVGSIFYTHSKILLKDNSEFSTITFGPVSILPELQRKGLGRAIISHSIEEAKKQGHKAIIIGGYPYHYNTYGFVGAKKYGISLPDSKFYSGILALQLFPSALNNKEGMVIFSDVYKSNFNKVEEYDKKFSYMKKEFQESQNQFATAVVEIDENTYL